MGDSLQNTVDNLTASLTAAQREIARLREALGMIAADKNDDRWSRAYARRALASDSARAQS